jgi:chromosome segregation ATPase
MTLRNLTLIAALALGLGACDQSKAELDQAKQQITTLTSERDNLKSQLDQANAKVTTLQQQVTDLQGKLAAASTPPPATAAAEEKPAAKTGAKKPAAHKPNAAETKQIEHNANTGAGHF